MDVTLTEQIKLTFPADGQREIAEQAFSAVTKRYAEACTYVSCYYFKNSIFEEIIYDRNRQREFNQNNSR